MIRFHESVIGSRSTLLSASKNRFAATAEIMGIRQRVIFPTLVPHMAYSHLAVSQHQIRLNATTFSTGTSSASHSFIKTLRLTVSCFCSFLSAAGEMTSFRSTFFMFIYASVSHSGS